MKIGIDIRPIYKPTSRYRGIGFFTRHLVKALLERDSENDYLLYTLPGCSADAFGNHETRQLPFIKNYRVHWAIESLRLGRRLRSDALDLFLATELVAIPGKTNCRVWPIVHDLIPLIFWDEYVKAVPWDHVQLMKLMLRRVSWADRVLTVSEWSKQDICRRLAVPEERVHVLHCGGRDGFKVLSGTQSRLALRRHFGLENRFLLYVGGSDYRKNLPQLVRAFSRLRERGYSGDLVLVGETFRKNIQEVRQLTMLIRKQGIENAVVTPGFVREEDLVHFYNAADLLVLPSRCEGFGLPVLEGLQCGVPVVAARTSAIPEVAGEEAVYFDPQDDQALVDALERVLQDPDLQSRLRRSGPARAEQFSWERAAQDLLEVYALDSG